MADVRTTLDAMTSLRLAEFARACKAALRAVSLYPAGASGHRLDARPADRADHDADGRRAVHPRSPAEHDPRQRCRAGQARRRDRRAVRRAAPAAGRHADAEPRRQRRVVAHAADAAVAPADEVRADGGIGSLWATAGGPSLEIVEIDYAEVLREKQGDAAVADRLIAAALSGAQLELDESGMRTAARDRRRSGAPGRADAGSSRSGRRTRRRSVRVGAFVNLLRGLAEYVGKTNPAQLDQTLRQVGQVAGRLSAEAMLELLLRRAQARGDGRQRRRRQRDGASHERRRGRAVRLELGHRGARPDRSPRAGVPRPRARHRSAAPAAVAGAGGGRRRRSSGRKPPSRTCGRRSRRC